MIPQNITMIDTKAIAYDTLCPFIKPICDNSSKAPMNMKSIASIIILINTVK